MEKEKSITAKKCITPEFRLSFPKLAQAESFQGGDPKYSITMLFDDKADLAKPATKNTRSLKACALAALTEKWGPDKVKWPKNLRMPFRDGNEKENLEGYADKIFIYASSKKRPGIVNRKAEPILNIEEEVYAGCYCRAEVIAFAYDTAGNRGVSFSLQNIQKTKDGESFSGKKAAEDVFDVIESDDDESENPENYNGASSSEDDFNLGF